MQGTWKEFIMVEGRGHPHGGQSCLRLLLQGQNSVLSVQAPQGGRCEVPSYAQQAKKPQEPGELVPQAQAASE